MTPKQTPAEVEHNTSAGLQIIDVHDGDKISKVLVDIRTRAAFPMDEVQWRELETWIIAVYELRQ